MSLKQQIESDLKTALLGGDKITATILRSLKGVILNAEIAAGKREPGLSDDEITEILTKENKKRREAADLYSSAGDSQRTEAENAEIGIISNYLPPQLSDAELKEIIDNTIDNMNINDMKQIGLVIKGVREVVGSTASSDRIAGLSRDVLAGKQ